MHAIEELTIDLEPVINRLKTTRNYHMACAHAKSTEETVPDFPWAITALEGLIGMIETFDTRLGRETVSYIDVIAEERSELMWYLGIAEASGNTYQFYVSAEGCIVYWFIDSAGDNTARQLDFTHKSLERVSDEELECFEEIAGYLIEAVKK